MKNLYEAGQKIETTIVAISGDTIFLDLGLKSEGILNKAELTDENGNVSVKEGDSISVFFLAAKGDELHFTTKLSGQNASGKDVLENAYKNGIPVEGHVTKEIKGGFEVMIGSVRSFCPYSQMGYRNRKEMSEYINQHLSFKIQEFKNGGKNIVVSNRVLLEEEANANLTKLSEELKVGMVVDGTVRSIESYGAFIEVKGFLALLPISEVSHVRVEDIKTVLKSGEQIKAKIIKVDWVHERMTLSTKELEADPWDSVESSFSVGTEFEGVVSRVADFGLFIKLTDAVDGLVHISKLPVERNTNLKKVYKAGDKLSVTVESIDKEAKRVALNPVVSNEEEENAKEYMSSHSNSDDDGETYNPFAALLKDRK